MNLSLPLLPFIEFAGKGSVWFTYKRFVQTEQSFTVCFPIDQLLHHQLHPVAKVQHSAVFSENNTAF